MMFIAVNYTLIEFYCNIAPRRLILHSATPRAISVILVQYKLILHSVPCNNYIILDLKKFNWIQYTSSMDSFTINSVISIVNIYNIPLQDLQLSNPPPLQVMVRDVPEIKNLMCT